MEQLPYLCFAYVLAQITSSEQLRILDWGGGIGQYHEVAKALYPAVQFDYHVAEVPDMCAVGRRVNPDVTFHDSQTWMDNSYDLAFASGAIQYVDDWRLVLRQLSTVAEPWLYLTRISVVESTGSYVMLQDARPVYDAEYFGWALSREELMHEISAAGLSVEREFLLGDRAVVDGAPEQPTFRGWLVRRTHSEKDIRSQGGTAWSRP